MTAARFEVRLHSDTGFPEDDSVNVWHAAVDPLVSDATLNTAIDHLTSFYFADTDGAGPSRVGRFLSPTLKTGAGATTIRAWTFEPTDTSSPSGGPVLGAPRLIVEKGGESDWVNTTPLPEEVSVCLSMKTVGYSTFPERTSAGAPGPEDDILPRARRRGRIFLGPLNAGVLATTSQRVTVGSDFIEQVVDSFDKLYTDMSANLTPLQVFSRADHAISKVNEIWIDNAFDTQRRRGLKPTTRRTAAFV